MLRIYGITRKCLAELRRNEFSDMRTQTAENSCNAVLLSINGKFSSVKSGQAESDKAEFKFITYEVGQKCSVTVTPQGPC